MIAIPPPGYTGKRLTLACPHCASVLKVRSSRTVTAMVRQVSLLCLNVECGASFGADLTITHAIAPSAQPNPAVKLRTFASRKKPANDDVPARTDAPSGSEVPPANDDGDAVATLA